DGCSQKIAGDSSAALSVDSTFSTPAKMDGHSIAPHIVRPGTHRETITDAARSISTTPSLAAPHDKPGPRLYLAPCGRTLLVHHVPGALPPCPHTRSPVSASCLMGSDHSPSSLPPGGLPRRGPYRPRLLSFSSSYT